MIPLEQVPTLNDEVDFGWWQPAGQTGVRLSWNRATRILFLFHAEGKVTEVLGLCPSAAARYLGERWLEHGGPEWVRGQVAGEARP